VVSYLCFFFFIIKGNTASYLQKLRKTCVKNDVKVALLNLPVLANKGGLKELVPTEGDVLRWIVVE
jgi:hypothetical protein